MLLSVSKNNLALFFIYLFIYLFFALIDTDFTGSMWWMISHICTHWHIMVILLYTSQYCCRLFCWLCAVYWEQSALHVHNYIDKSHFTIK